MTELRCRMMADMKLHGLAPGTQQVYLKSVERLARHFHRSPDRLSEQDLRDYFTYLAEKKRVRQQHAPHRDFWGQVPLR